MQEAEISELKSSLREKEIQISLLNQSAKMQEAEISELIFLNNSLKAQERQIKSSISAITNSFSYQLTRPVRIIGKFLPDSFKKSIKLSAKYVYWLLTPHKIPERIRRNKIRYFSKNNNHIIKSVDINENLNKERSNSFKNDINNVIFILSLDPDTLIINGKKPYSKWSHNLNLFYFGNEALRNGSRVAMHIIGTDILIEVSSIYPEIKIVSSYSREKIEASQVKFCGIYPTEINNFNKLFNNNYRIHNILFIPAIHWLESPELFPPDFIDIFRESFLLYVDDVVVQNKDMQEIIHSLIVLSGIPFERERISIAPSGFAPEEEENFGEYEFNREEIRKEMGLNGNEIGIINSGGFWKWTDLDTFLESFIEIHREIPNNKLIFFIMGLKQKNNTDHSEFINNIVNILDKNNDLIIDGKIRLFADYENASNFLPRFNFGSDIGVNVSKPSIENAQSHRQRFIDYLKAKLPVINTMGDPMSRSIFQRMMFIVEPKNKESYKKIFKKIIEDPNLIKIKRDDASILRDLIKSDNVYLPVVKKIIDSGPIKNKIRQNNIRTLSEVEWVKRLIENL
ncbi:hypothetical protein Y981_09405 [Leptospirillum ferriphilum YSK]|uniref:Glycosyl transferase family 1 domain-containing protein n=2 Tax=Leptospirillum ferriphilum TaxID=178606 RepID=A0A059XXP2_9BACT|nr:hypothetical protein Y981_09405 [Leptospirillum ferriphilum YSK]